MGIDPRDSITSESLPDCCWPGPELFFPRRIVSVSARVPAADNPDKELRLPESSMDNRSDQPAKSAGDYRLHFPFFIPITLSHWERARVRVRSLEKERKREMSSFLAKPSPQPSPIGRGKPRWKMKTDSNLQDLARLKTPSRGLVARFPSLSCLASVSHSSANVVTRSGAFFGKPVSRTRKSSCSNFTGWPVAKIFTDETLFTRLPMTAVSPGQ